MIRCLSLFEERKITFFDLRVTGNTVICYFGDTTKLGTASKVICTSPSDCDSTVDRLISEYTEKGFLECYQHVADRDFDDRLRELLGEYEAIEKSTESEPILAPAEIRRLSIVLRRVGRRQKMAGNYYAVAYQITGDGQQQKLLVWLPEVDVFATWDQDRKWLDVLGPRLPNDRGGLRLPLGMKKADSLIWGKVDSLEFIPATLGDELEAVLRQPGPLRSSKGLAFLGIYELTLHRHAFAQPLKPVLRNLLELYYMLAVGALENKHNDLAIDYLERSLVISHVAFPDDTGSLARIFLYLSYCYFQKTDFDRSAVNFERYQLYEPNAQVRKQMLEAIAKVKRHYQDALEAYRLAVGSKTETDYRSAMAATEQALHFLPDEPLLLFNKSCFQAALGNLDEAFESLTAALQAGFEDGDRIRFDAHLASLRGSQRFGLLMQTFFPRIILE